MIGISVVCFPNVTTCIIKSDRSLEFWQGVIIDISIFVQRNMEEIVESGLVVTANVIISLEKNILYGVAHFR